MFPERKLTELAVRKIALRRDIAVQRAQCAAAAVRVARPLEWLERVVIFWRRLSPLAQGFAVPLGSWMVRVIFLRRKRIRSLARWGPIALRVVRLLLVGFVSRRAPASSGG